MAETRKIAAILAADVVGFSRMTSADEDGTLARLRKLRAELIDPTVASQNGRVFKRTGDGALVEFRSVVEAVRCAITIQNAMIERNVGMPADQRIVFRIGIHLGDVVEESDGDLMGDGVNIAARLEGLAQPGAICLSEQAYWQVKGRLDLAVTDLGPTQLKNIAEMDADAELNALVGGHADVAFDHRVLNCDGAPHRFYDATKFDRAPSSVRLNTWPFWLATVGSITSARSARDRASVLSSSALAIRLKPTTSAARIAAILRLSVIALPTSA